MSLWQREKVQKVLSLARGEGLKRVFITGIAGFIGFHLAQALAERGDAVTGIDNFNSYYDPALKKQRRDLLRAKWQVEVAEGDLLDFPWLRRQVQEHQTTHLVHLAAQAGVRYSLQAPQTYIHTNIEGFLHVLEICRANPEIALLFASSSSVYGLNESLPFREEDRTDSPASLYAVSKKTNELMAYSYHHLFGVRSLGLRFFTVYGPWGRPDMAMYSFAQAIVEGRPINVYNEGHMYRDFTYVTDTVAGTIAALDSPILRDLLNLGRGKQESVLRVVSLLEEGLQKKALVRYLPREKSDPLATHADIEKSQRLLGYDPQVPLEEGIAHFCRWFMEFYKSSK